MAVTEKDSIKNVGKVRSIGFYTTTVLLLHFVQIRKRFSFSQKLLNIVLKVTMHLPGSLVLTVIFGGESFVI